MIKKLLLPFTLGVISFITVVSFQNCSKVMTQEVQFSKADPNKPGPGECFFNGKVIKNGDFVDAYLNSSVPIGQSCVNERRFCKSEQMTGSYSFASCEVGAPSACLFNGQTIAHGHSVEAYVNSTAPFGSSCTKQTRTCNDGKLSGDYAFGSCQVGAASSCLFNGKTIAHNETTVAYLTSTVPFGNQCSTETRTCYNGILSGTYGFASCNVGAPASCLFNDQTIAHGQTVNGFKADTVAYGGSCSQEVRTCNNGILSGTFGYSNCKVAPADTSLPNTGTDVDKAARLDCSQNLTTITSNSTIPYSYRKGYLIKGDNLSITVQGAGSSCFTIEGKNNVLYLYDNSKTTNSINGANKIITNGINNTLKIQTQSTYAEINGDNSTAVISASNNSGYTIGTCGYMQNSNNYIKMTGNYVQFKAIEPITGTLIIKGNDASIESSKHFILNNIQIHGDRNRMDLIGGDRAWIGATELCRTQISNDKITVLGNQNFVNLGQVTNPDPNNLGQSSSNMDLNVSGSSNSINAIAYSSKFSITGANNNFNLITNGMNTRYHNSGQLTGLNNIIKIYNVDYNGKNITFDYGIVQIVP